MEIHMHKITPFLCFDHQAEEAVSFYTSIFKNSSDGGDEEAQQCGWLKDRYGLSWQVVPTALFELISDPDPKKSQSVMKAMLQMKKIDIAAIKKANAG